MAKRAQPSSQSLPSSSAPLPRPTKRTRRSPPPSSSSLPEPSTLISQTPSHPSQPSQHPQQQPQASTSRLPALPKPSKRSIVPGTLRRLSSGRPVASTSSSAGYVRPKQTLAGAKVGGKSKDLRDGAEREEMWVKRSGTGAEGGGKGKGRAGGQGLGFGGYLKKGVGAFVDRGCVFLFSLFTLSLSSLFLLPSPFPSRALAPLAIVLSLSIPISCSN